MKKIIAMMVCMYATTSFAQILIDESRGGFSRQRLETYSGGQSFKSVKKVGIQTTLGGATGLFGINLDLNFTKDFAFSMGVGTSRGFQSFNAHIKKSLGSGSLAPYFVAGYSRWYAKGDGSIEHSSPPLLANKFLTGREKATGTFAKDIIYPGFGLQYVNTSGDWQGLGFFAEAMMLVNINDLLAGGSGGLGSIYYF